MSHLCGISNRTQSFNHVLSRYNKPIKIFLGKQYILKKHLPSFTAVSINGTCGLNATVILQFIFYSVYHYSFFSMFSVFSASLWAELLEIKMTD